MSESTSPVSATGAKAIAAKGPILGPPEEEFWERYNRRLEFPLATVATILLHVLIAVILVYVLTELMGKSEERGLPPMRLMEVGGLDDFGDGSAGSGGTDDPLAIADGDPVKKTIESLPDPSRLPEIRENLQQTIKLIDPTGNLPISDTNAAAYGQLDEAVRNKLLGARQGAGNQAGKGADGSVGKGPGGTGANSTLGRNMRWTLRFKVSSGRDYLDQLRAMGAKLLIPMPGTEQSVLIEDLRNPNQKRVVGKDELSLYADLLKFGDSRRDAVQGVAGALSLDFTPRTFFAIFTKELEADLSRKETAWNNRRAEDIEETIFVVGVRDGSFQVNVTEQKLKR